MKDEDKSCNNCGHHYQNGNKCDARPCRNGNNWIDLQPIAPLSRERVIEVLNKYEKLLYEASDSNNNICGIDSTSFIAIASELCDAGQREETIDVNFLLTNAIRHLNNDELKSLAESINARINTAPESDIAELKTKTE